MRARDESGPNQERRNEERRNEERRNEERRNEEGHPRRPVNECYAMGVAPTLIRCGAPDGSLARSGAADPSAGFDQPVWRPVGTGRPPRAAYSPTVSRRSPTNNRNLP